MYIAERTGDEHTWGQSSSSVIPWEAVGIADYGMALALFMAATPLQLETGLWRQNVKITQQKAIDIFYAEITYGVLQPPDPSTWQWEIDATTETVHVTSSKECLALYAGTGASATPLTSNVTALGDDGMGHLEGFDIVASTTTWTEQHQLLATAVPFGYPDTIDSVVAQTNTKPFRGLAVGEALFLGANIKRSSNDPLWVDASYRFRKDKQKTIQMQGVPRPVVKPPHSVIDVRFTLSVDNTAHASLPAIAWVGVHRVYDATDFSVLGIGV